MTRLSLILDWHFAMFGCNTYIYYIIVYNGLQPAPVTIMRPCRTVRPCHSAPLLHCSLVTMRPCHSELSPCHSMIPFLSHVTVLAFVTVRPKYGSFHILMETAKNYLN